MIKLNNSTNSLVEAFGFQGKDCIYKLLDFFYFLTTQMDKHNKAFSWAIGRIWIDEMLSDNEKAYLIFSLGRLYHHRSKGGEDDKDHFN